MTHDRLHRRLRLVDTLAQRGATVGERAAARQVARRLRERLREASAAPRATVLPGDPTDPIRQGHADLTLPDRAELAAVVQAWRLGEVDDAAVGAWACTFVGGLLLPDLPADDPDSIPIEVLLQLSTVPGGPVGVDHADGLLAFLSTGPNDTRAGWARWFATLADPTGGRPPALPDRDAERDTPGG